MLLLKEFAKKYYFPIPYPEEHIFIHDPQTKSRLSSIPVQPIESFVNGVNLFIKEYIEKMKIQARLSSFFFFQKNPKNNNLIEISPENFCNSFIHALILLNGGVNSFFHKNTIDFILSQNFTPYPLLLIRDFKKKNIPGIRGTVVVLDDNKILKFLFYQFSVLSEITLSFALRDILNKRDILLDLDPISYSLDILEKEFPFMNMSDKENFLLPFLALTREVVNEKTKEKVKIDLIPIKTDLLGANFLCETKKI